MPDPPVIDFNDEYPLVPEDSDDPKWKDPNSKNLPPSEISSDEELPEED